MKPYPARKYTWFGLVFMHTCLIVLLSACQGMPGQVVNKTILSLEVPATATVPATTPTEQTAISMLVPHQGGKNGGQPSKTPSPGATGTPSTAATPGSLGSPNPGTPPGPVPSGTGFVPAAFPSYLSFGVMSNPGTASVLDSMHSQNGTVFNFRYQYLTGGVNTGHGWETWNQPAGQYATNYMQESAQHGYIPAFVYYEICLSNGPNPSSYCGGHNIQQDTANLANAGTMQAYYANWVLMLQKIGAFGKPVLVIVEPDLWGFLQNATNGTNNAANVPASVNSSGYPDAAGFPDTAQGFAWALLHMRDKYAPNAILALHASCWAAGDDVAVSTNPNMDVTGLAQREATFLNSAGLVGNPTGVSSWDVLSNDVADFDSGQPGGRSWWDRYNQTFPNFARYLNFIGQLSQNTHRRVVMWQVPIGNQYFDTMDNSPGHYQDNRAEYILGNAASFAAAGVVAVLFGPGNGGTMNTDAMNDGVTNPAPISSYECNYCNNHTSIYPDDDGGYLRIFIGQYMQHPVSLP